MRTYKRLSDKGKTKADVMLRAARQVKVDGRSVRSVAKDFDMPYRTLDGYCHKFNEDEIKSQVNHRTLDRCCHKFTEVEIKCEATQSTTSVG